MMKTQLRRLDAIAERLGAGTSLSSLTDEELAGVIALVRQRIEQGVYADSGDYTEELNDAELDQAVAAIVEEWRQLEAVKR
jgi:hypothetical protein